MAVPAGVGLLAVWLRRPHCFCSSPTWHRHPDRRPYLPIVLLRWSRGRDARTHVANWRCNSRSPVQDGCSPI